MLGSLPRPTPLDCPPEGCSEEHCCYDKNQAILPCFDDEGGEISCQENADSFKLVMTSKDDGQCELIGNRGGESFRAQ